MCSSYISKAAYYQAKSSSCCPPSVHLTTAAVAAAPLCFWAGLWAGWWPLALKLHLILEEGLWALPRKEQRAGGKHTPWSIRWTTLKQSEDSFRWTTLTQADFATLRVTFATISWGFVLLL